MLGVFIGFVSGGLLLLTMGILIRSGMTWLIAGYEASQVKDEKGLARWFGNHFISMGLVGIVSGSLVMIVSEDFALIPIMVFVIVIPVMAITLAIKSQRFTK